MKSVVQVAVLLVCANQGWSAQRYSAAGLILRVDSSYRTIFVSCESIAGYMDARVIPIAVHDAKTLVGLVPGLMIDFTLIVDKKMSYAESIRVRNFEDFEQQPLAARRLKIIEDLEPDKPSFRSELKVGQRIPSVVLEIRTGDRLI
jgi:hypothetical protein